MIYVEILLDEVTDVERYTTPIKEFKRISSFPSNAIMADEGYQATISPASWEDGGLTPEELQKMTPKEQENAIKQEEKFLVVPNRYASNPENEDIIYLEFSEDDYGRFVYVSKLEPEGICFSAT